MQLISPFAEVLEIAPAKVLPQGAVRLHQIQVVADAETQVRLCALAGDATRASEKADAIAASKVRILMMIPFCWCETAGVQAVVFAAPGFYAAIWGISRFSPRIDGYGPAPEKAQGEFVSVPFLPDRRGDGTFLVNGG